MGESREGEALFGGGMGVPPANAIRTTSRQGSGRVQQGQGLEAVRRWLIRHLRCNRLAVTVATAGIIPMTGTNLATKEEIALIAHLMRRAGFGAPRSELEAHASRGYEATVEWLLHPEEQPQLDELLLYRYHPTADNPVGRVHGQFNWLYRMVNTPRSCSTGWPGVRRMPRILSASRLNDTGAPDFKSKTATPTGEVSISVSRPALALIDTGYTGSLIVPNILAFGSPDAQTSLHVGDGRTVRAPVYVGILEIKGFPPMYGIAVTLLGDEYIWAEDFLTSSRLPLTTARGLS